MKWEQPFPHELPTVWKLIHNEREVGRVTKGLLGWIATVEDISVTGFPSLKAAKAYTAKVVKR